jgi:hypothetical protein
MADAGSPPFVSYGGGSSLVTCAPYSEPDGGCADRFLCTGFGVDPEFDFWTGLEFSPNLPAGTDMFLSVQVLTRLTPEGLATASSVLVCSSLRDGCCNSPVPLDQSRAVSRRDSHAGRRVRRRCVLPSLTSMAAWGSQPCGC